MTFFSFQDIIACTTGIMVLITLLLALELITRTPEAPQSTSPDKIQELQEAVEAAERDAARLKAAVEDKAQTVKDLAGGKKVTRLLVEDMKKRAEARRKNLEQAKADVGRLALALRRLKGQREKQAAQKKEADEKLKEARRKLAKAERSRRTVLEGDQSKTPLLVEVSATEIAVGKVPFGAQAEAQEVVRFSGPSPTAKFLSWIRQRSHTSEYFVLLMRSEGVKYFEPLVEKIRAAGFQVGWDVWPPGKELFPKS